MKESRDNKVKVAVLDFGSSAIKLAIAEKNKVSETKTQSHREDYFRVIHLDSAPAEGAIQRGVVFNLSETSEKVRKLISHAEQELGIEISNVYANISGQGLHSLLVKQSEDYDAPHEITQADIDRLWGNIEEHEGRYYLNADFARFYVNGSPVQRPIGVKAMKLQVSIQTVVTDTYVVDNVDEVLIHKLGLEVQPYLSGMVELAKRILTPEQKRIGSALIDFGAETTTVCYFNHGVLEALRVIPMGGNQVTYDLTALDISPEEAERVKISKGSLTLDTSDKEEIVVKAPDMSTEKRISRYSVNQYIEARTREIVDNIKAVIARAKRVEGDFSLPGGIAISGGASKLTGLVEYLKEMFGGELSVKQIGATLFANSGNQEMISTPEFHALYAMLFVADSDVQMVASTDENISGEPVADNTENPVDPIIINPSNVASDPNERMLPFDEEDMKNATTPIPNVANEKPKKVKRKKESKGGTFARAMKGIKDLFAMSENEEQYSDDDF